MMIRRTWIKIILIALVTLVLVSGGVIFGISRGYFTTFVYNDRVISREEFFHLFEVQEPMHCTDETWSTLASFISRGRVVQCFDTMEALSEYMAQ